MRTTKFRAWNDALLRMDYQPEAQVYDFARVAVSLNGVCEAWGKNLMQFTGLKDKNGRDIYEGDILQDLLMKNRVVEYNPHYGFLGNFPEGYLDEEYEVIGNVFENPDLLATA